MKVTKNKTLSLAILHGDAPGWTIVSNKFVDQRRWNTDYTVVVKDPEGLYWQADYSRGSTEIQDESPWEYEESVTWTQVAPRERTVVVYVPVGGSDE